MRLRDLRSRVTQGEAPIQPQQCGGSSTSKGVRSPIYGTGRHSDVAELLGVGQDLLLRRFWKVIRSAGLQGEGDLQLGFGAIAEAAQFAEE